MAAEWIERRLAEVMDITHGFAFPGEGIRDEPSRDILVTPGNFAIGGGFKGDKFKYFTGEVSPQFVFDDGDLVVTMTDLSKQSDTLGYPAIVPRSEGGKRFLHNQRVGKVITKPDATVDRRFLFYLLRTAEYRHEVLASATGTSIKHTSPTRILAYKACFPPLREQQAIGCILGALDDKIELNRRRNQTLEAMARAIFQSWFVDFDPVRANTEGRTPAGQSPALAALFPDSFTDSPLGPIPTGWRVGTIKDTAARIQYGLTTSATQVPGGPQFLRITDIRGGTVDWSNVPYCDASDDDREKYRIHDGDIFVARTGASTGENVYLVDPPLSVFASYLVRFQFTTKGYGRIVGEFMRSLTYFEFVKSALGGSAQPNANAQTLAGASLVFPPEPAAEQFYEMVRPFDLQRATQDKESCTLAALRDALLPKLISGELRVPEAERIAGRAL